MGSPIAAAHGPLPTTAYAPGNLAKSTNGWTDAGDSTSGLSNLDRAGGGIKLTMDGTDNDVEVAHFGGESIDPTTKGVFGFTAVVKVTEADTSDSDWFVGYSDTPDSSFWSDSDVLQSMVAIGVNKKTASMFFRKTLLQATTNSGDTSATSLAFASATVYRIRVECTVNTNDGIKMRAWANEQEIGSEVTVATTSYGLMEPCFALSTNGTNAEVFELHEYTPYSIPA